MIIRYYLLQKVVGYVGVFFRNLVKPLVETPRDDHVAFVDNITPIGLIRIRPKFNLNVAYLNDFFFH